MKRTLALLLSATGLLMVAITFQNCAKEFDPSQYGSKPQNSTGTPAPTGNPGPTGTPSPTGYTPPPNEYPKLCTIANGAGRQETATSPCLPTACDNGYHIESSACLPNERDCTAKIAGAVAAKEVWVEASSNYGACTASACASNYQLNNGQCAGPFLPVYRYNKIGVGHYYSLSAQDAAAGQIGYGNGTIAGLTEGEVFKVMQNTDGTLRPLFLCVASDRYAASTSCPSGMSQVSTLGYIAATPGASGANISLYLCSYSNKPIRYFTTITASECTNNGMTVNSTIGYVP